MPERDGARADAGSYADKRAQMRAAGGFLIRGGSRHREDLADRPAAAAPSAEHRQRDPEKFAMREGPGKRLRPAPCNACRRAYQATAQKRNGPLNEPCESRSLDRSRRPVSRDDADPALGSARCDLLFPGLRGGRSRRGGRARLLEAVAAIDVDMAQTHVASPLWAGTG